MLTETRSSAVQILPQIQPVVEKVINFIRSPSWIVPLIGSGQHFYSQSEIESFVKDPSKLMVLRKTNEAVANSIFSKVNTLFQLARY